MPYNPAQSRAGEEELIEFLKAPIPDDLLEIPGVGPASKVALIRVGIQNPFMLIGKYLSLKESGMGSVEHHDRFYDWYKSVVPPTVNKNTVVHALAERMSVLFPGVYDSTAYEAESS